VPESDDNLRLEIGHVLFIDIVGYSKLLIEEQKERLHQLTAVVLATAQVRESSDEQLVRLPTGDGMALVFRHSAEEPARCALEVAEALQKHPELPVRMGIHSGPVSEVTDVSGRTNIAGAGINMAQRVMDCGDAGHILLSQHVADDLVHSRQWTSRLRDLGECEAKHGVRLHLANLYAEPLGNAAVPQKFQQKKQKQKRRSIGSIAALVLATILAILGVYYFAQRPKGAAIPEKSIAVLPFVDMSPGKDQGYFSDGLAEELLNVLTKVPELRVTSRSSAFSFKDRNLEVPEIGKLLHVEHVLEGSVRKSGDRIRVTAQLIDARTDTHVWSETYDRTLDDIFSVQDEISAAVVEHLKISLLGAAPRVQRVNPRVFELFLEARQLGRLHSQEGYEKSVALYRQGLAIDPAYAPAWTGLAYDYRRQANNGMVPMEEGYGLAQDALQHALQVNPAFAPALAELGRIALDHDGDLAGAARHFEHAFSLEPHNLDIIGYCAIFSDSLGRFSQAIALNEYAVQRDPANPTLQTALGIEYRFTGKLDQAVERFRTALSLSPGEIATHYRMGEALLQKGDAAGALAAFQHEPLEAWRMTGLPLAYRSLRRFREEDAALASLLEKYSKGWPYNMAYVFAWRGDNDRAFEFLDRAFAEHDPSLSDVASETLFASLHKDRRWLPFLGKIGRAPEQLTAIRFDVKPPTH